MIIHKVEDKMSRVDWSKVSLEIKENIFLDLYNVLESPM